MASDKTFTGNFFEDFRVGQVLKHATPRTITEGDVSLYTALYGPRFALQSSDEFARSIGLPRAPVDDVLAFHMVFGKTVPDVSLNAVANLGYAGGRFGVPVYPGDIVVGDAEGVVVIPAKIAEEVAAEAEAQTLFEDWVEARVKEGRSIFGLYPPNAETKAEFEAWKKARK